MSDWSTDIASTDDDVDEMLGDTVQFSPGGGAPFTDMQVFVNPEDPGVDFSAIDPLTDRPRLKVARSKIPTPAHAMRFIAPQLDAPAGTKWRPENWTRSTKGRYWIIELQKAVT